MKGWWFVKMRPVPAKDAPQPTPDEAWSDAISEEFAGARSTFPIIYYGSYVGLLFALFCIYRAIRGKQASALDMVKWFLYALLWIAIFIWCLFLDATLFHVFIRYHAIVLIVHIVGMVLAVIIGIISIMQKAQEGERYYERHRDYERWK